MIWDDHEFANDCWQDHANDFEGMQGDEKETERREAATRAFYEYIPVDAPYRKEAGFPEDLSLYRSFSYGKHLTLVLTDQRYYRSDHVIREDALDFRSGKFLPFSPLGSRIFAVKEAFDEKEASSGVTMLGEKQFQWTIRTLRESSSTWKFLASPTVMAQMILDLRKFETLPQPFRKRFYFKLDQWDGYRSERARLCRALRGLKNFVVLSGDIHGFYASRLYEDFDSLREEIGLEFVCAGISSSPVREQVERVVNQNPLLKRFFAELVSLFDQNLFESNPHILYGNGSGYGYLLVEVSGEEQLRVFFRETSDVTRKEGVPPFRTLECVVVPGIPPRVQSMIWLPPS